MNLTIKNIQELSGRPVGRATLGKLFLALTLFTIIMSVFIFIAREVIEGETLRRDTQLLLFINSLSSPVLDRIMIVITTLGDVASVLTIATCVGAYLYYKKRYHALALLLFSMSGAAILNIILKLIFERHRPHLWELLIHESTYSFPSGHAMLTSTLVFALVLLAWKKKWRWWIVATGALYVGAVGFSRMYLGVHYPTDIIAGWCVATVWVIIVSSLLGAVNWGHISLKSSKRQAKIHM